LGFWWKNLKRPNRVTRRQQIFQSLGHATHSPAKMPKGLSLWHGDFQNVFIANASHKYQNLNLSLIIFVYR
jgi:hypothetical protein